MSDEHHDGPYDWKHGAPHNSFAPLLISIGVGMFLFFFAGSFTMNDAQNDFNFTPTNLPLAFVGLGVIFAGLIAWWRQDISHDSRIFEPASVGPPFRTIDIRKVGMWVFLMSEMMIFSTLFSTYIRYRTSLPACVDLGVLAESTGCFLPASHLIASSWWHLAPGAANTFALILSSFTVVNALRIARNKDWTPSKNRLLNAIAPDRRRGVRNYLIITTLLAMLFLTLKMVEWFIGFNIAGHDVHPLVAEGYTIHQTNFEGHNWDIRVSASTFYVVTGTHGMHVIAGIIGLLYLVYKAHNGAFEPGNARSIEYFGLYWHFVDLVWVVVFPAFYLF
jgi:cytochrome c oxidase subunit I+III